MRYKKIEFKNLDKWLNYVARYKDYKIYILSARNSEISRLVFIYRHMEFDKNKNVLYGNYFDVTPRIGLIDDGVGIEVVRQAMVQIINTIEKTPNKGYNIPEFSGLARHNLINRKCHFNPKKDDTVNLLEFLTYLGKSEKNRWAVATLDAIEMKKR